MSVRTCGWIGLLGVLSTGCAYQHGAIDYAANPELKRVRLYTGRSDPTGESLPVVTAIHQGKGSCTEVAAVGLANLVEQASVFDADGVKDVRFRGRWNWMGSVVCRPRAGGLEVQIQGVPYRLSEER